MTLSSKLNLLVDNKNRIKQALEAKGAEVGNAPLSQYPQIIEGLKTGGGNAVGKISIGKLNTEAEGWLPADGSRVSASAYPELANIIGMDKDYVWENLSGIPPLAGTGRDCAFSPDGKYLAVTSEVTPFLTVIDTSTWTVVSGTPVLPGRGNGCAFSPEGEYLAVAHVGAPFFTVLRTSDWSEVAIYQTIPNEGLSCTFSPNGKHLAVSHAGSPRVTLINTDDWWAVTGFPILPGSGTPVWCSFSPNSRYLAVVHSNYQALAVIDVVNLTNVAVPTFTEVPHVCAFSPDGNYLAVGHARSSRSPYYNYTIFHTKDWSIAYSGLIGGSATFRGLAFSPDGKYLAMARSTSGGLVVIEPGTWTEAEIPPSGSTSHPGTGWGCTFSSDGKYLAVGHTGTPFLTVINIYQEQAGDYFSLPSLPPSTFGDLSVQPMIRTEDV